MESIKDRGKLPRAQELLGLWQKMQKSRQKDVDPQLVEPINFCSREVEGAAVERAWALEECWAHCGDPFRWLSKAWLHSSLSVFSALMVSLLCVP